VSFEPAAAHATYSPLVLLAVSLVLSIAIVVVVLAARNRSKRGWLGFLVALSPIPLLVLAHQHLPLVGEIVSPSFMNFCFGQPGFLHVASFLLPPLAGLLAILGARRQSANVRHAHGA